VINISFFFVFLFKIEKKNQKYNLEKKKDQTLRRSGEGLQLLASQIWY